MNDEEDEEIIKPKNVEIVAPTQFQSPSLPMSSGFQLDPISAFFLLPILPLVYLFNMQAQLMNQISQNSNRSSGGKITTISRDGNTLTVVEKYL